MSLLARAEMAESKLREINRLMDLEEYYQGGWTPLSREVRQVIKAEVWDGYQFLSEQAPAHE